MNKVSQAAPELYDAMKKAGLIEDKSERGDGCVAPSCSAASGPETSPSLSAAVPPDGGEGARCPFCGSPNWVEDVSRDEDSGEIRWHFIYCITCDATGPLALTESEAVEAFTRRHLAGEPPSERSEVLKRRRSERMKLEAERPPQT